MKKQQPKPQLSRTSLVKPPAEFFYQAVGILQGQLVSKGSVLLFQSLNQSASERFCLKVKAVDPKLACYLLANPDIRQGSWMIYPKQKKQIALKAFLDQIPEGMEVGQLYVSGQLLPCPNPGVIRIQIQPNLPRQDKPFSISLKGYLPNAEPGQFWRLEAEKTNQGWALVDGGRVDDTIPKAAVKHPKPSKLAVTAAK